MSEERFWRKMLVIPAKGENREAGWQLIGFRSDGQTFYTTLPRLTKEYLRVAADFLHDFRDCSCVFHASCAAHN